MSSITVLMLLLATHEILDVREVHNGCPDLPRRVRGLSDAPYSNTVLLFPQDRSALIDAKLLNRAYAVRLREMAALYGYQRHIEFAIREADAIHDAYDALIDAKCGYYLVHIRRQALAKLLRLLGDEDFAAGRMPLPIPMWEVTR